MRNTIRFVGVGVGIVLLTSLSIDATNTFQSSQSALGALVGKAIQPTCPSDMVQVNSGKKPFCIDKYEYFFSSTSSII